MNAFNTDVFISTDRLTLVYTPLYDRRDWHNQRSARTSLPRLLSGFQRYRVPHDSILPLLLLDPDRPDDYPTTSGREDQLRSLDARQMGSSYQLLRGGVYAGNCGVLVLPAKYCGSDYSSEYELQLSRIWWRDSVGNCVLCGNWKEVLCWT